MKTKIEVEREENACCGQYREEITEMNSTEEIWKDIKGYKGLYQVSNFGRVRSLDRYVWNRESKCMIFKKGKILKSDKDRLCNRVALSNNSKFKFYYVDTLVAENFISNFDSKKEIIHLDSNPKNDCVYNLKLYIPTEDQLVKGFKRIKSKWTPEMLEILKQDYKKSKLSELAERFGSTEYTVKTYAGKLGVKQRNTYTEDIFKQIKELMNSHTYKEIAQMLNLSYSCIVGIKRKFKEKKSDEYIKTLQINSTNKMVLSDKSIAMYLAGGKGKKDKNISAEKFLQYPHLIELKRSQLLLNRAIKNSEKCATQTTANSNVLS